MRDRLRDAAIAALLALAVCLVFRTNERPAERTEAVTVQDDEVAAAVVLDGERELAAAALAEDAHRRQQCLSRPWAEVGRLDVNVPIALRAAVERHRDHDARLGSLGKRAFWADLENGPLWLVFDRGGYPDTPRPPIVVFEGLLNIFERGSGSGGQPGSLQEPRDEVAALLYRWVHSAEGAR
jgi:hypothetical protein